MKVAIIGGVAGGASAATRLRRLDEKAEIIMFERGEYVSFANCGLPYYIGGEITDKANLTVQTPVSLYKRFHLDVRILQEVINIDRDRKLLTVRNLISGQKYEESYDKLILSPGAEPIKPRIAGIENEGVFTLRNIPDTLRIKNYIEQHDPRTAIVVGGGYIGLEMAENLAQAGLEVTLVELLDHVVGPLDYDAACDIHHYLRSKGVRLLLNSAVESIRTDNGKLNVTVGGAELETDMVLLSVGIRPDSALAKDCGLSLNAKGAIIVDQHMRTSDEDIYAVGDAVQITDFVTGKPGYIALAGPANKQGRIAADNICKIPSVYKGTQGSSVLKLFDMTIATTGINENTAKNMGIAYDKVFLYPASHATYYPGASNISMKVLFEKPDGRILGAQLAGFDGVDKRCDVLAAAIRSGMTAYDLAELELCYAPPYSSAKDPVNMAGFMIENLLTGKVKQYHWHDVDCLPRDGSIALLDIRAEEDYNAGHIEGAVNIPLTQLRERMKELDPAKPLYINCYTGLTSYIACRMLTQHGFDCHNLAGGYRLYDAVRQNAAFHSTPTHPCGEKIN
ncbi:MAG: FAD-dependent oxidoreductase [Christensenellales bacterium]